MSHQGSPSIARQHASLKKSAYASGPSSPYVTVPTPPPEFRFSGSQSSHYRASIPGSATAAATGNKQPSPYVSPARTSVLRQSLSSTDRFADTRFALPVPAVEPSARAGSQRRSSEHDPLYSSSSNSTSLMMSSGGTHLRSSVARIQDQENLVWNSKDKMSRNEISSKLLRLTQSYLNAGAKDRALVTLDRLVQLSPELSEAAELRAKVLESLGTEFSLRALDDYHRVLSETPGNLSALQNYIALYCQVGDIQRQQIAWMHVQRAKERYPQNMQSYLKLELQLLQARGDLRSMKRLINENAVADIEMHMQVLDVLQRDGKISDVLEYWDLYDAEFENEFIWNKWKYKVTSVELEILGGKIEALGYCEQSQDGVTHSLRATPGPSTPSHGSSFSSTFASPVPPRQSASIAATLSSHITPARTPPTSSPSLSPIRGSPARSVDLSSFITPRKGEMLSSIEGESSILAPFEDGGIESGNSPVAHFVPLCLAQLHALDRLACISTDNFQILARSRSATVEKRKLKTMWNEMLKWRSLFKSACEKYQNLFVNSVSPSSSSQARTSQAKSKGFDYAPLRTLLAPLFSDAHYARLEEYQMNVLLYYGRAYICKLLWLNCEKEDQAALQLASEAYQSFLDSIKHKPSMDYPESLERGMERIQEAARLAYETSCILRAGENLPEVQRLVISGVIECCCYRLRGCRCCYCSNFNFITLRETRLDSTIYNTPDHFAFFFRIAP